MMSKRKYNFCKQINQKKQNFGNVTHTINIHITHGFKFCFFMFHTTTRQMDFISQTWQITNTDKLKAKRPGRQRLKKI